MGDTEYLNEFYKHVSTDSILVVTASGELIRLYCPFRVKAKVSFPEIEAGTILWVEKVQITPELKDVFIINKKAYFTAHFQVIFDTLPNETYTDQEKTGKNGKVFYQSSTSTRLEIFVFNA